MTAHFAIWGDEVGGFAANLIPSFLMLPPVMSTKGACARMETSPNKLCVSLIFLLWFIY